MKNYLYCLCLLLIICTSCKELRDEPSQEDWIRDKFIELKAEYEVPATVDLFEIDPAALNGEFSKEQIEKEMRIKLKWWAENHAKIDKAIRDANEADAARARKMDAALSKATTKRDTLLTLLKFPDEARHIPRELLEYYNIEVEDVPIDTSTVKY